MSPLPAEPTPTPPHLVRYTHLMRQDLSIWLALWNCLTAWSLWAWLQVRHGLTIQGREHFPQKKGSFIVVANHTSYWDPPLVTITCLPRPVAYMAKLELFQKAWLAPLLRSVGTFAVNRSKVEKATIRSAKEVLSNGHWLLGLFPEGTRSQDGEVQSIKRGVAFFARSSRAGVLPMGLSRALQPIEGSKRQPYFVYIGPFLPYDPTLSDEARADQIQTALTQAKAEADRMRDHLTN